MKNVSIPTVSEEELNRRYKRIKPVITLNGKLYNFRNYDFYEISNISYFFNRKYDVRKAVQEGSLKVWEGKDFLCLHKYGYYGVFQPTIAEVLAQINEKDIPFVRAFEIIDYPKKIEDFDKNYFIRVAFERGYHVSTIRLYVEK